MGICPNCRGHSRCSCGSCIQRRRQLESVEVWLDTEIGIVACGHCGFAMVLDAWAAMDCDMFLPSHDYSSGTPVAIPGSLMSLEEACEKYRPMGKMPGEPNYRPSFLAHWKRRLWRWRGITGYLLPALRVLKVAFRKH